MKAYTELNKLAKYRKSELLYDFVLGFILSQGPENVHVGKRIEPTYIYISRQNERQVFDFQDNLYSEQNERSNKDKNYSKPLALRDGWQVIEHGSVYIKDQFSKPELLNYGTYFYKGDYLFYVTF